jgi:hypothetical protein
MHRRTRASKFIEDQFKEQNDDTDDEEVEFIVESKCKEHDEAVEEHTIKENKIIIGFYFYSKKVCGIIFKIGDWVLKISGIYLIWIALHFFASHIYIELCVPKTIYGFIVSPFLMATPHCQTLRWIVYNAASTINNMWIVMGTWLCSQIMFYTNTNQPIVSS